MALQIKKFMISQTKYLFVAMMLFLVVTLIALIANPDLVTTFCSVDTGITSQVDEVLKEGSNLKSDDLQPKKVDDAEVQEKLEPRKTVITYTISAACSILGFGVKCLFFGLTLSLLGFVFPLPK